jgi:hypothetical protein
MNGSSARRSLSEAVGSAGAVSLTMGGLPPVSSRWTWQPVLPELWLREHEGRQLREMLGRQKRRD